MRATNTTNRQASLLLVNFSMGSGLVMQLATEGSAAGFRADTPRTDPLADLVRALRCFAVGTPDVSCRWPAEPDGHFLDLSRTGEHRCGIAVHRCADPGSSVPERGALVFGADLPFELLVGAFATALDDLRADYADEFGERWPWPFPDVELSRLKAAQSLQ